MDSNLKNLHPVATAFNDQVEVYEEARPGYPADAIEFLINELGLNEGNKVVLELGSGTGKFTRHLLPWTNPKGGISKIIAVEPSAQMRQMILKFIPDITALEGTAEAIPLENNSVDAVIAAQSFHWFATTSALKEIHRVLKKGGKFMCIWNLIDGSVDWVKQYRDLFEQHELGSPQYRLGLWRKCFEEDNNKLFQKANENFFKNVLKNRTMEIIWKETLSKSYISAMTHENQEKFRLEVIDLLQNKLKIFGDSGTVDAPYNTQLHCVTRVD